MREEEELREAKEQFRQEMLEDAYDEKIKQGLLEDDPLEFILNKYADELQEAHNLMTPIINELFEHGITMSRSDLIKEV